MATVATVSDGCGVESVGDGVEATMLSELQALRLTDVRERARLAGVGEDAVDAALNTDNPKAAMINLLVEQSRAS